MSVCSHDVSHVITRDGDIVCRCCACVLCHHRMVFHPEFRKRRGHGKSNKMVVFPTPITTPYKSIFHFNERISQWTMQEPIIKDEVWDLIYTEYIFGPYPRTATFHKNDLARIIGSIAQKSGPTEWKVLGLSVGEPTNVERMQKRCRRRLSAKYLEKWISIRYTLTGYGPGDPFLYDTYPGHIAYRLAGPCPELIRFIKRLFLHVEQPFEYYRHTPECRRPGRYCHKLYKCRHNLPHYNTMVRYFLYFAFLRGHRQALDHLYLFPPLRTVTKLKKHEDMMRAFWKYNFWYPFIRIFPELEQKPKDKIVSS